MPHCPLLKVIRPVQPISVPTFLLFRGLCLWRLWSVSASFPAARFSRWLFSNSYRCSLLKAAGLELFPLMVRAGPGVPSPHFLSESCALDSLLLFQREQTSPHCPVTFFPQDHQVWRLLKICPKNFASAFPLWCFGNVTLSGHSRQCYYGLFGFCWGGTSLQSFWHPSIRQRFPWLMK
jgi:hypothetical protein